MWRWCWRWREQVLATFIMLNLVVAVLILNFNISKDEARPPLTSHATIGYSQGIHTLSLR